MWKVWYVPFPVYKLCLKFCKGTENELSYMNVIFITFLSPTCFVHSCDLNGDEDKNKNTVIMWGYHQVDKNHVRMVKIPRFTVWISSVVCNMQLLNDVRWWYVWWIVIDIGEQCIGVKLGRWHCGRKGSWGCLRTWCWGEYLDLGGTR